MRDTMDIRTPQGSKVVFAFPDNGWECQQEDIKLLMNVGDIFTVDDTEFGGSWSNVYLEEFPNIPFNTVFFANVEPDVATDVFHVSIDGDHVEISDFITTQVRKNYGGLFEVTVSVREITHEEDEDDWGL